MVVLRGFLHGVVMSSSIYRQSSVNSHVRNALLCAAFGTTALTALTAAPDTAYADCVATGPNTFNIDNNNNGTRLVLFNDCPGVGASNTVTILPGTNILPR